MRRTSILARTIVALLLTHATATKADYYTVKPGDGLTSIADKKREQSGGTLTTEQVMLTLYNLNKDAFINGDIDKLIVSKQIFIPDNDADYLTISKDEAEHRLRSKNYAAETAALTAANARSPVDNTADPSNIAQTLKHHQQEIELLKSENTHIMQNFKLLERALGRIVAIQGVTTEDLLKVKSALQSREMLKPSGALSLESPKPAEELKIAEPEQPAPTPNPAPAPASNLKLSNEPPASQGLGDEFLKPAEPEATNSTPEPTTGTTEPENTGIEPHATPGEAIPPILENNTSDDSVESTDWLSWLMWGSLLLPLVLGLLWALNIRQMRTGKNIDALVLDEPDTPKKAVKERLVVSLEERRHTPVMSANSDSPMAPTVAFRPGNPGFMSEAVEHSPSMTESNVISMAAGTQAAGLVAGMQAVAQKEKTKETLAETPQTESGMLSNIEYLDLCLLFGDYQQAHKLSMQESNTQGDSPVLARKIAFIERKLASA